MWYSQESYFLMSQKIVVPASSEFKQSKKTTSSLMGRYVEKRGHLEDPGVDGNIILTF
jgi:hypothetical protein